MKLTSSKINLAIFWLTNFNGYLVLFFTFPYNFHNHRIKFQGKKNINYAHLQWSSYMYNFEDMIKDKLARQGWIQISYFVHIYLFEHMFIFVAIAIITKFVLKAHIFPIVVPKESTRNNQKRRWFGKGIMSLVEMKIYLMRLDISSEKIKIQITGFS